MHLSLKTHVRPGPALAVGLLFLGLIVDLGFTGPQIRNLTRSTAERDQLRQQMMTAGRQKERGQTLARALGGQELDEALRAQAAMDPIDYLGRLLAQAGLRRTELGTQKSVDSERLRRTSFFLRACGRYGQIVAFLRDLEESPRLVLIDDFTLQPAPDDARLLEARIELSMVEPLGRP
jgi:Tfp pilus assembly protein PilO